MNFRLWLEGEDKKAQRVVFCDLDETLVHNQEVGWLKDHPKNKDYAKMLVPGKHPFPEVIKFHAEGEDRWVFPRPGCTEFVKEVNEFADFYILTHSTPDYVKAIIKHLPFGKYVKGYWSTKETAPNEVAKKLNLKGVRWVLIDNMKPDSIEMIHKLRILGLGNEKLHPKEEAKLILSKACNHFIKVEDWIPTVDEYDDFELWKTLPKVKEKLGIDW
jgi:FMN phosphatase YigB (HAD superfamily)